MKLTFATQRAAAAALLLPPLLLLDGAGALNFELAPTQERCVSEQIPSKTMLTGDWEFGEVAHKPDDNMHAAHMHVQIHGPDGASLFSKKNLHAGHFAITAQKEGAHRVCITSNVTRTVSLNLKTALEVADHDTVAKKEHVEAIEAELDRMKKMAVHVYE